ncbi:MAG: histidinol-phosphate transaminase [Butyrivibrio sp.]|nr:histidinol-phosphate transaminase [Butyrivibrio sp.]
MSGWEQNVRQVTPYTPGEQPRVLGRIIKLNTNENPYPPAPGVTRVLESFQTDALRLYPDPQATELVQALSEVYAVPQDQIFVGVGSDDVLAMAFLTFFSAGKEIWFPDISYSFYDVWAALYRIPYRQIPVSEDLSVHAEDYYGAPGGVVIANPNAPTGLLFSLSAEEIEEIIRHNQDCVVIIDEAYIDFGGVSVLPLIQKYDNLLVVQTFSKSRSLAGLRIGYAFGSKKLIDYLQAAKFAFNSYTMNRLTVALGAAALADDVYFRQTCDRIITTRERMKKEMSSLGFVFPDSKTNFLFVKHPDRSGKEIFEALRERNIYVRHWDRPRISEYNRITVGTEEEVDLLLQALREIL